MTLKVNIHIFGLTEYTIYCKICSCFPLCCYYAHLTFQIKRIISSEKWFNYVVTFFFFLKMPKIWVGRTTLNGEKGIDQETAKCCEKKEFHSHAKYARSARLHSIDRYT